MIVYFPCWSGVFRRFLMLVFALAVMGSCTNDVALQADYMQWRSYLGGKDRNHYSVLNDITPDNVTRLQVAWEYDAPDYGQMQMNPIVVDTLLYGVTAALRAVAIHAETGKEVWQFGDSLQVWHSTSRGVSFWESSKDKRIFFTRGSELWALDALTGKPIPSFGNEGAVDLRKGLPKSAGNKFVISNTPGTIYEDLIIMPLRVSEGLGAAPGYVMAFDVVHGDVRWVFRTLPLPGDAGFETWEDPNYYEKERIGGANNWAGMAVDVENNMLFVPTGSMSPDFYGGSRKGKNLYANSLLALEASSGKLLWHYQFTHHDIWDRDLPAPPNLITVDQGSEKIKAVVQITKQGYVFAFDRFKGTPLFAIEERPVPPSSLEGEKAWPTQPFPVKPKPFARQSVDITEEHVSPYAENAEALKATLQQMDKRVYGPPSLEPVLLLPGYDGGAEWGGAGADPENGILYVNSNEMPRLLQMAKDSVGDDIVGSRGQQLYTQYCAVCHQPNRQGLEASGFPSLVGLAERLPKKEALQVIKNGKGMMVGFPQISDGDMESLMAFLYEDENQKEVTQEELETGMPGLPYRHLGYKKFLDSNGFPAIDPPWGTLHAIDMNSGDYLWSKTLGTTPELEGIAKEPTGCENYGGPVITKNGLLFIAATKDGFFRAFDRHTGEILWEYKLPAPAFATPAMYEVNGKQYIALACGGEKLDTPKGNKIIAFALENP